MKEQMSPPDSSNATVRATEPAAAPSSGASSAAAEPAFLPGETSKELDAGRMNEGAALMAAEERRLGRPLTLVEASALTSPLYR